MQLAHGSFIIDDEPRNGRPPALTPGEQETALAAVKKELRSLKRALGEIVAKVGKAICPATLRGYWGVARQVWKRVRRSLRSRRDEASIQ